MTRPLDTALDRTLACSTDSRLRRRFMVLNDSIPANLQWGRLLEVLDKLAEDVGV